MKIELATKEEIGRVAVPTVREELVITRLNADSNADSSADLVPVAITFSNFSNFWDFWDFLITIN